MTMITPSGSGAANAPNAASAAGDPNRFLNAKRLTLISIWTTRLTGS
jgi:hypothetical protein